MTPETTPDTQRESTNDSTRSRLWTNPRGHLLAHPEWGKSGHRFPAMERGVTAFLGAYPPFLGENNLPVTCLTQIEKHSLVNEEHVDNSVCLSWSLP